MKKCLFKTIILSVLSLSLVNGAVAATDTPDKELSEAFSKKLNKFLPKVKPDSVKKSPINGLYEVIVGPRVYYFSPDARYLINANIIDLKGGENLTKPILYKARRQALDKVGDENMLTFSPKDPQYLLTVFTDIDCGYCRKLHAQIEEYNKLGIGIRYMFFPRSGVDTDSYKKAETVWCDKDRKAAFTKSKTGAAIPFKTCDNPVKQHLDLVQQLQLRGTPAMVLPSGELIESYIPPADLLKLLLSRDGSKN